MSRVKLISYIKHPELLEKLPLQELQDWVREFPYSQNLRTLLAKKIKSVGKEQEYPEVFQEAALYSTDRIKLYENLNDQQEEPSDPVVEETIEEALPEDSLEPDIDTSLALETEDFEDAQLLPLSQIVSVDPDDVGVDEGEEHKLNSFEIEEDILKQSEELSTAANKEKMDDVDKDEVQLGLSEFSQWLIDIEQRDDHKNKHVATAEVISESLATILADQGHSQQASDMYAKLILKYPEKSAYFAAQIEKLKSP